MLPSVTQVEQRPVAALNGASEQHCVAVIAGVPDGKQQIPPEWIAGSQQGWLMLTVGMVPAGAHGGGRIAQLQVPPVGGLHTGPTGAPVASQHRCPAVTVGPRAQSGGASHTPATQRSPAQHGVVDPSGFITPQPKRSGKHALTGMQTPALPESGPVARQTVAPQHLGAPGLRQSGPVHRPSACRCPGSVQSQPATPRESVTNALMTPHTEESVLITHPTTFQNTLTPPLSLLSEKQRSCRVKRR